MIHYNKTLLLLTAVFCLLVSCAEDTGTMGVYATEDGMSTSSTTFQVTSKSLAMGAVIADNSDAYLGKVVDPETGCQIEANCAAQFYCLEDYTTPRQELLVGDTIKDPVTGEVISNGRGQIKCDSIEVRLYLKSYYGLGNCPLKMNVYALDSTKVMEEDSTYYSDIDLTRFLAKDAKPIATKVFTPEDYILTDDERTSSSHNANIRVILPREVGQRILEKCYSSPSSFKDSYHFIREVFPGLFFTVAGGEGTMLTFMVSTVNLYYRYSPSATSSTVYSAVTRFAATPEVIQSTRFDNDSTGINKLLADSTCTYLKTPAGICTELTLPIDEVFNNHANDSISLASIALAAYNKKSQEGKQLGTSQKLLMVRKQNMKSFFKNRQVTDSKTSFTTSFSDSYNNYTFSNIGRLLSYCKQEKTSAAKAQGISEDEWAAKNPDWNKVVLIPVTTSSNTSGNLTSVNNDMSLCSVRLVGGATDKLSLQIIYSRYNQGE